MSSTALRVGLLSVCVLGFVNGCGATDERAALGRGGDVEAGRDGGAVESPPWVQAAIANGWNEGEWLAISGPTPTSGYDLTATNTMVDVSSAGKSANALDQIFFTTWTGAAICSGHRAYGTMMFGPGGNHGGGGSPQGEIYLFDLETRRWEEVAGPDTSGFDESSEYGEYESGRPITNHSAYWPLYDAHRNEYGFPKGWGSSTSASMAYPKPYGHGLDLAAYDAEGYSESLWRRWSKLELTGEQLDNGFATQELMALSQQNGGAWDASRDSIWIVANHPGGGDQPGSGVVARYHSPTDSWTKYPSQWTVFNGTAYAIDPERDVLAMASNGPSGRGPGIYLMDLANPEARQGNPAGAFAFWKATSIGSGPEWFVGASLDWSPARRGFVYHRWNDLATTYLASYVSGGESFEPGVETDYTLSWSSITADTNAVIPPAGPSGAGHYSKARLARWGDTEILIFAAYSNQPVYAQLVTAGAARSRRSQ